jgi:hypothetical protein
MPFLTRVTLTAFVTCTALELTSSGATRALKQELGELPDVIRAILHERQRSERLDEQGARTAARTEAKRRLFAELAAGRLSLPQAAARFRELCAEAPQTRDALRILFDSGSDEERLCRFLIYCVEAELAGSPGQPEAVGRRLNAELEARLRSGRPLVGP